MKRGLPPFNRPRARDDAPACKRRNAKRRVLHREVVSGEKESISGEVLSGSPCTC
jgi:hypothetical protein